MSDEQKRDSGGGPPPPGGGVKPAGTETVPPEKQVWLPPRLRDRLYGSEDEPPPKEGSPLWGILAMVVIAGMVAALFFWKTSKNRAEAREAAERARVERAAVVADSLAAVHRADSLRAVRSADSVKTFLALPVWKRQQILAGGDTSKASAPVVETGRFTIDAGTFLFEDAAQTAMTKIKGGTRLAVRVAPVEKEGTTSYHVYVGEFREKAEATYVANQLFEKGTLPQANVVKLD